MGWLQANERNSCAGICVHGEAEEGTQRRWIGTEQEERDAPAREMTQICQMEKLEVSVLVRM